MKLPKISKKGVAGLDLMPAIAIALIVGFVFLATGAAVMQGVFNAQTANSAAANVTQAGLNSLLQFSSFGTVIGLIAVAVVILVLLSVGLGRLTGRV